MITTPRRDMRPSCTGAPGYEETYDRQPEAVPTARHLVAQALDTWALPQLTEDAVLVVAELVTNAVKHATGARVTVAVERPAARTIRIVVTDASPTFPKLRHASPDDEGGRGLVLVGCMAHAWRAERYGRGKRVWAEMGLR
ncbi:ATP-binding protein [Streptomyces noursei]